MLKRVLVCVAVIFALLLSCTKEQFYEGRDAALRFSTDTVSFDTVFTSIGSATAELMVYNPYTRPVMINTIALCGGTASKFVINIDGISATSVNNMEIRPKDSLYIFLQVYINPLGANQPLLIKDSIQFKVNNNVQYVNLEAIGQDVHFFNGNILKTQTWPADKPYLIYGNVTVDTLQTLTIAEGANIFFHRNANLRVKGTLIASGTFTSPITLASDRLEKEYADIPGQWGGVSLLPGSRDHVLNWVVIKNGTSGLILGEYNDASNPNLVLSNTIIENMSYSCLLANNSTIKAWNCLIADAGSFACGLIGGGNYLFYQCTLANYYASRSYINIPTLYISDYFNDTSDYSHAIIHPLTQAGFFNTIAYGNDTNEFSLDLKQPSLSSWQFDHCLLKCTDTSDYSTGASFNGMIWNKSPLFENADKFAFEPDSLSPAIDAGDTVIGHMFPFDLKMADRTRDKGPDIGAYEWVEK